VFSNARKLLPSLSLLKWTWPRYPHENQHHRAQIRALRIQLSDNDFVRNRWDQLASYFSQPTEWPNLTELWVLSPSQKTLPGLMLQIPGVDSFHYCRKESDNLVWCVPMQQLTTLRLCHVPIDQCLYLLFHCSNLIEFHCSTQRIRINTRTIFPPEAIFSPSRTPKICSSLRLFHWKAEDEDWNWFFCSPQFDFLTSRSSPGECRMTVYDLSQQNLSTAYW